MPEFEEPETPSNSQENYTPSTDASKKPRTRRRSGGFKTEQATQNLSMGEVDPVDALKEEKLSGSAKPAPEAKREAKRERPARKAEAPERGTDAPKRRTEARSPRRDRDDDRPRGNAQPSPETLAAIKNVEERLDERKKERDARRAEREKNRPAKSDRKPQAKQTGSGNKKPSGGIIASILSFFGIGTKPPAKKSGSGKPSGNRGQGDRPGGKDSRPRGKSGDRSGSGQNRRGGKGGKSGKGRRSGGNRPRRNDNRKRDEQS